MAEKQMLTFLSFSFTLQQVNAYYCDSNRCSEDEYCCGLNICCTSYRVWGLWYFWLGLVFFLFLLSSCAGFWKYRYRQNPVIITLPYSPLSNTDLLSDEEKPPAYTAGDLGTRNYYSENAQAPPPPYGMHGTYMSPPPTYTAPPAGYADYESRNQNFYQH